MRYRSLFIGFAIALILIPSARAADTLDIYVLDAEGGKAEIIKTPAGQAVLIDAGFPTADNRDINRILALAQTLGISSFDYLINSHMDVDHVGNIPAISQKIPIKMFVDHGNKPVPDPNMNPRNTQAAKEYLAFIPGKNRMIPKPGDRLPLKDVDVTILTADEKVLDKPLKGAGQSNAACPSAPREQIMSDDNGASVGELWQYGNFRMVDFGDLLKWVENRLVCPVNKVGQVDLFMVNHHGVNLSNSPELVAALAPKVALMNNGDRKGNSTEVATMLREAPSKPEIWQLHFSPALPAALNAPEDMIANMSAKDDKGFMFKISGAKDGSFTITNLRNGFSKTYK